MNVVYLGVKNNSIIFKLMFLMHLLGGEGAGWRGQCLNVVYLGDKNNSIIFKLMFLVHLLGGEGAGGGGGDNVCMWSTWVIKTTALSSN